MNISIFSDITSEPRFGPRPDKQHLWKPHVMADQFAAHREQTRMVQDQKRAYRSSGPTFREAAEQFFEEVTKVRLAPSSVKNVRSMMRFHVLPAFGDRPLRSIGKADVKGLIREIASTRKHKAGPYGHQTTGCRGRAISVHGLLKALFGWASDEDAGALIDTNPIVGLKTPFRSGERDRWLSANEIRWFWAASGEEGYPYGTAARLLLLTGARRGEIAALLKHQIDRKAGIATIPIAGTKSRNGHIIPLSDLALDLLDSIPSRPGVPWVFSVAGRCSINSSPLCGANKRIHARMIALAAQEVESQGRDPAEAFVEHWTYHDLRRTCATALCFLGVPLHIIDKQLNHAGGSAGTGRTITAVTRIYCRWEFLKERAAALQSLGEYVSSLVATDADVSAAISDMPEIVRLPALRAA